MYVVYNIDQIHHLCDEPKSQMFIINRIERSILVKYIFY